MHGTGKQAYRGSGVILKEGVPEGQYGVFLPSPSQEGPETVLRGGVTSPDSRGAGGAPGLDRRELPSWKAGKVKSQAGTHAQGRHNLMSESAQHPVGGSEASCLV